MIAVMASEGLAHDLLRLFPALDEMSPWLSVPLLGLLGCALVTGWITVFALFAIWLERKVAGHIQCRLGPMEVGPHGLLQTVADGIKLMAKEDVIPRSADRILFIVAPVVVFTATFLLFVVLPFDKHVVVADLNIGVFYLAAIASLEVIGVIMAGWASNNKWSLFGAMREATQMVSYEIPLGLALLSVVVVSGTLGFQGIVETQSGWFWRWHVFRSPFLALTFIIYYIAALAECKRAPFDLPEAESELVSGFHTEYSSMRFSIFFLAEYAFMFLVCGVATSLWLGGWNTGIPALDGLTGPLGIMIRTSAMLGKSMFLVFLQIWIRWTYPRIRLDQVMYLCLKVLVPFGFASLIGATLWELAFPGRVWFLQI